MRPSNDDHGARVAIRTVDAGFIPPPGRWFANAWWSSVSLVFGLVVVLSGIGGHTGYAQVPVNSGAGRPAEVVAPTDGDFLFNGGSPIDFLKALQTQYGADLMSVAEIAPGMDRVRVPKLRLQAPRAAAGQDAATMAQKHLENMILFYNQLATSDPRLGRLFVRWGTTPDTKSTAIAVVLGPVRATNAVPVEVKTRAFPLRGLPEKQWEVALNEIEKTLTQAEAEREANSLAGTNPVYRSVRIHQSSGLLVATGLESDLEFVASVLEAMRANEKASGTRRMYSVLGKVNRPGRFELGGAESINILEALAEAGGAAPTANLRRVVIQRMVDGELKRYEVDARLEAGDKQAKPFNIEPNDIITVPESKF